MNTFFLDAATLQDLCREHHETFDSICLQLDHYKNWKPLALNFKVPVETLQKIGTSSSCAETVLESIEKKQPDLTVKKMRDVLSVEMLRKDVCDVLDKYPELKGISYFLFLEKTKTCRNWRHNRPRAFSNPFSFLTREYAKRNEWII